MASKEEVREFLKNAVPTAREKGLNQLQLALFLRNYGIAIRSVVTNPVEEFKHGLAVEFINDHNEIEEAIFDLVEIDGRTEEEIFEDMNEKEGLK